MSHKVKVMVAINCPHELAKMEALTKELTMLTKVYGKHMELEIKTISDKLAEIKKMIKDIDGQEMEQETAKSYLSKISSAIKTVANLKQAIKYGKVLVKKWENQEKSQELAINKLIAEHGMTAMLAIINLQNEGQAVTIENLKLQMEKMKHSVIEKKQLMMLSKNIQIMLLEAALPDAVKTGLAKKLKTSYTYQEAGDLAAYIEQKISDVHSMETLAKTIIKTLEAINFKNFKLEYEFLESGTIKLKVQSYKDTTKDFILNIYSDRSMDWQFGNYEHHLCDADGEQFQAKLKENGVSTTIMNITRNVSNAPRLQQQKSQVKGKQHEH